MDVAKRKELVHISIHALRGEGDIMILPKKVKVSNFNPRPPWGGRPPVEWYYNINKRISIHALRGEGDFTTASTRFSTFYFNPRPPWGGRRFRNLKDYYKVEISIHALRGEGDTPCKPGWNLVL